MSDNPQSLQQAATPSPLGRCGDILVCVVRSTILATVAYSLAVALRLHQPVWAPVSALITVKDNLGDTYAECRSRIVGTIIGAAVAVLGQIMLSSFAVPLTAQLAIIIAVTAAIVASRPQWRVGIWTAAITLLSQLPDGGIWQAGLARFAEVTIGSVAAAGMAALELSIGKARAGRRSTRP